MKFPGFLVVTSLCWAPALALAQGAPAQGAPAKTAPVSRKAPAAPAPTPAAPAAPASVPAAAAAAAAPVPAAPASGTAAVDADIDALIKSGGLTAQAAASRAAKASPEVRRKAADVAAANAAATKVQLVNVPRVAGTLQYVRLSSIDAPEIAPGFSFPVLLNSYSATAEVNVPLSDYVFRIPSLVAGARAALEAAKASQLSTEVNVGSDAKIAYYEWVRANLQKVVADRSITQVEATVGQIRSLVEVQRASRADMLRVEAQLAQTKQAASQLAGVVALRAEVLRLAIGAPLDEPLTIGEDIREDLSLPPMQSAAAFADAAIKRRLEVRTLDAGIRAKEKQRDAEKAGKYPRLSAFGQLNYANPNQRIVPSHEEFDLTWQAGLALTWNINDFLNSKTSVEGYDAEVRGLTADRDRLSDGIRIEIVAAVTNLQTARSAIDTTAQGLVAAEESYRVRKELLALERATAVELVDAEAEVTRARIAALSARVDLRVALAQLAHALGQDVP